MSRLVLTVACPEADPETGEMPPNPVPQVGAGKIIAVVGMKGTEALAAMGLQSLPIDP